MTTAISRMDDRQLMAPSDYALVHMTPEQLSNFIMNFDRVADARQRMIQVCLKRAEPKDFWDFDGKPYLQGKGADRIASTCGISLGNPRIETRWVEDDCFIDVSGEAEWPFTNVRITAHGSCSTRDKFYAGSDGQSATLGKYLESTKGNRKLACEMLLGSIRKKAVENWKSRAVCSVLGVRGLTWERLAELGYTADKSGGKVKFKTGANKAKAGQEVPYVTLAELAGTTVGSIVRTSGTVTGVEVKDGINDKGRWEITTAILSDGQVTIRVGRWCAKPDWLAEGITLDVLKLHVKEYQGKPKYEASEWSMAEPGSEE